MNESEKNEDSQKVIDAQERLSETTVQYWLEHVLFSFNWWFLLFITVVSWVIWWKLHDKESLVEASLVGALISVSALLLDSVGISYMLWAYGSKLFPMTPYLHSVNLSLLPVLFMLIYQWFSQWKHYVMAHILLSALGSFAAEPIFIKLGIYILLDWKTFYSFPIYIVLAVIIKWMVEKMKASPSSFDEEPHSVKP